MIKYLIKTTNEIRVATEEEADTLHKEMIAEAAQLGVVLSSWSEVKKERKAQGEVVEEWYICKYTLTFNDPKAPLTALDNIKYNEMSF